MSAEQEERRLQCLDIATRLWELAGDKPTTTADVIVTAERLGRWVELGLDVWPPPK